MRGKWFHKIVAARGGLTSTVWTAPVRYHGRNRKRIHARAISSSHIQRATQNIGLHVATIQPLRRQYSSLGEFFRRPRGKHVAHRAEATHDSRIPFTIVRRTTKNHLQGCLQVIPFLATIIDKCLGKIGSKIKLRLVREIGSRSVRRRILGVVRKPRQALHPLFETVQRRQVETRRLVRRVYHFIAQILILHFPGILLPDVVVFHRNEPFFQRLHLLERFFRRERFVFFRR